jgi:hypothetical protein
MNSPIVSVTFDVGYLRKLALREADKFPELAGKKLSSIEVYNPCNDDQLDGIMVFFEEPKEDLK